MGNEPDEEEGEEEAVVQEVAAPEPPAEKEVAETVGPVEVPVIPGG